MAMRAAAAKIQVCLMESSRKMMTTTISRYFSSDGRVFSEEEKAAENIYIKKMERERIEKAKKKLEKEKPAAYKYKSDKNSRKRRIKKIELPTHYLEANYRTMKAVVFYAPNIAHIPQSKVLQEMEPAAGETRNSC